MCGAVAATGAAATGLTGAGFFLFRHPNSKGIGTCRGPAHISEPTPSNEPFSNCGPGALGMDLGIASYVKMQRIGVPHTLETSTGILDHWCSAWREWVCMSTPSCTTSGVLPVGGLRRCSHLGTLRARFHGTRSVDRARSPRQSRFGGPGRACPGRASLWHDLESASPCVL